MNLLHPVLHADRWRPLWRIVLVICVLITAFFAFAPRVPLAMQATGDKLNHLLAFSAMGFSAVLAGCTTHRAVLALLGWGVTIEAVQALLPLRTAAAADVVADAAGIAVGLLLAAVLRRASRMR